MGYAIVNNLLQTPPPEPINSYVDRPFPYVFIGDDAFPMRPNLLKPYPNSESDIRKRIANYRISRARRVIENTFGIMASRFRIYRRPIIAKVELVESITKACVALHNYLMADRLKDGANRYCPPTQIDRFVNNKHYDGEWRNIVRYDQGLISFSGRSSNNYRREAKTVRDMFCDYFLSKNGEVSW